MKRQRQLASCGPAGDAGCKMRSRKIKLIRQMDGDLQEVATEWNVS